MNILHCSTYSTGGGAAIAAKRISTALRMQGVDSSVGCAHSSEDTPEIRSLLTSRREKWRCLLQKMANVGLVLMGKPRNYLFTPGLLPSFVHKAINTARPDIVHLHWLANLFLPLYALARVQAPIVWTLHDVWAFTGGCYYTCGRGP